MGGKPIPLRRPEKGLSWKAEQGIQGLPRRRANDEAVSISNRDAGEVPRSRLGPATSKQRRVLFVFGVHRTAKRLACGAP